MGLVSFEQGLGPALLFGKTSRYFLAQHIARMADYPMQINIRFLKSNNKWISGVGEEAIPQNRAGGGSGGLQDYRETDPVASVPKQDLRWT